jgi:hypothetical protein
LYFVQHKLDGGHAVMSECLEEARNDVGDALSKPSGVFFSEDDGATSDA